MVVSHLSTRPSFRDNARRRLFVALTRGLILADRSFARARTRIAEMRTRLATRLAFRLRPDDVFIVSYPKAGTTVLQMMLYQMFTDGSMSFAHINGVVPWFELVITQNPALLERLASPRLFKSHRLSSRIPRGARQIYLLRNPKDSCVSYFYHAISISGDRSSLAHFVQRFASGAMDQGSWFEHFADACHPSTGPRLLIAYDDIVNDLGSVVDRVAAFCGKALSPSDRQRVITRCGIEFMRAHNHKFDPRSAFGPPRLNETSFVRKGAPGNWLDELTPAMAAVIDRKFDATLGALREPPPPSHLAAVSADPREAPLAQMSS